MVDVVIRPFGGCPAPMHYIVPRHIVNALCVVGVAKIPLPLDSCTIYLDRQVQQDRKC